MSVNSKFLNDIGLTNFDLGYLLLAVFILSILLLVAIVLLIVQICKTNKLKRRIDQFVTGKDGKSLEGEIAQLVQDNKELIEEVGKNKKNIKKLFRTVEGTFQKVGLVKYDAFQQMGGQLSFSIALLDQRNNGFILNSVHSTDGCYSYTKEIKNGECALSLGKEEEEALQIALDKE